MFCIARKLSCRVWLAVHALQPRSIVWITGYLSRSKTGRMANKR
jgi:hypothetical protein